MRLALSPVGFALLGGVDVAALAISLRRLDVARDAAAGDMAAAMELSALGSGFDFVTPLAFGALLLTLIGCALVGARHGAGRIARLAALPLVALALAVCAVVLDQPSATTEIVVRAATMWVAACGIGVAACIVGGLATRARAGV